jgi:hypothetical protein
MGQTLPIERGLWTAAACCFGVYYTMSYRTYAVEAGFMPEQGVYAISEKSGDIIEKG